MLKSVTSAPFMIRDCQSCFASIARTDVGEARGKAGAILLTLIMLGGGFGFVKGHEFQQYMQETTTEEQVYQQ